MEFRKAVYQDIDAIMEIINAAKDYFRSHHIDQWQNGYPNEKSIGEDISKGECYVLCDEKEIIACGAIIFGEDPCYNYIEDGAWLTNGPYGTVHRIAIAPNYKGKGLSGQFFTYAKVEGRLLKLASLRVDTHEDNLSMQRLIAKNGFQYCGVVYMEDGGKRLAYEYAFEKE